MKNFLKGLQKGVTKLTLDFIISGEIAEKLAPIAKINRVLYEVTVVASTITTMTVVDIVMNEVEKCGDSLTLVDTYNVIQEVVKK